MTNANGVAGVAVHTGKTDATGYFRIDLRTPAQRTEAGADSATHWAEHVARLVLSEGEASAVNTAAPQAAAGGTATMDNVSRVRVEVAAPSGRVVFTDPMPPSFDVVASEFRYYVLDDGAANLAAAPAAPR